MKNNETGPVEMQKGGACRMDGGVRRKRKAETLSFILSKKGEKRKTKP